MRATFILSEVGIGLRRNLTMTIAVVITFAVSLGLFGGAPARARPGRRHEGLLVRQGPGLDLPVRTKTSERRSRARRAPVTAGAADEIRADLESLRPLVQEVYYESSAEAYERFTEQFKDSPDRAEHHPGRSCPSRSA